MLRGLIKKDSSGSPFRTSDARGYLESLTDYKVTGWFVDRTARARDNQFQLRLDGYDLGSHYAVLPREDVRAVEGTLHCGFVVDIRSRLADSPPPGVARLDDGRTHQLTLSTMRGNVVAQLEVIGTPTRGYLERCDARGVSGWAVNLAAPNAPADLEILANGEHYCDFRSHSRREDVTQAGLPADAAGFYFEWPLGLFTNGTKIEVRHKHDGRPLSGSPATLKSFESEAPPPSIARAPKPTTLSAPDLFDLKALDTRAGHAVLVYGASPEDLAELPQRCGALVETSDLYIIASSGQQSGTASLLTEAERMVATLAYPDYFTPAASFVHLVNAGVLARYRAVCRVDAGRTLKPIGEPPPDHVALVDDDFATLESVASPDTMRRLKTYWPRLGRELPPGEVQIPSGPVTWIHRLLLMQMAAIPVDPADLYEGPGADTWESEVTLNSVLGLLANEGAMNLRVGSAESSATETQVQQRTVKAIAFYLPQFHPIPENDQWWGRGFTEWSNVTAAKPLFRHHHQPRLPADLGYYDLRLPETQEAQAELAADHGVHGFCYYYYWFNGRKILNQPIEQMLASGRPNFPFCVCWANENWSRNWDGQNRHVLLEQHYSLESNLGLIREFISMMKDPRYIRHKGRPVVLVYRISIIPDWLETARRWREECWRAGIGEIHLCAVRFGLEPLNGPPRNHGLDSYVLFPPHEAARHDVRAKVIDLQAGFAGELFEYDAVVEGDIERFKNGYPWPVHRGTMLSWDNTARRSTAARIFVGATPMKFRAWLSAIVDQEARFNRDSESLVFINAWNEWAEGTILEPEQRFGRGYLEAVRSAVGALAPPTWGQRVAPVSVKREPPQWIAGSRKKVDGRKTVLLCAHISGHHLFGGERSFLDVLEALGKLGFDVVVTLPSGNNAAYIDAVRAHSLGVYVFQYPQWAMRRPPDEGITLNFADIILDHDVSIVYVNTIVILEPLAAAKRLGRVGVTHVREIITLDHGLCTQIGLPPEDVVRDVLARTDFVIANSGATRSIFSRRDRTFYVPNAADIQTLDIPNKVGPRIRVGIVSSNIPKKGLFDFIEVAKACVSTAPNAEFVVIGPDNPMIDNWRSDQRSGRLPTNIRFVGYRESPRESMAELNVLLNLSSFAESFGRTVAEALAARRPVIAYEWGALPELLKHGECGYLAPFRDIAAVAAHVADLCASPEAIIRMGEEGRERICRLFSPESLRSHLGVAMESIQRCVTSVSPPARRTTVVVPVFNAVEAVERCLHSVSKHTPLDRTQILVIDDGSTDARVAHLLERFESAPGFTVLTNPKNLGYTRTVNLGLDRSGTDDVVLLNSDTLVTPHWLPGLKVAAYASADVGTVTAMSDNAGAFSFPEQGRKNSKPASVSHDDYAVAILQAASHCKPVAVPTGSGFCMFIRRDLIDAIGKFDEEAFPRGYGEENDFCMRALANGWTNVVTPWSFVFHERTASFGAEKAKLVEAGVATVTRRYPDYTAKVREAFNGPAMQALRAAVAGIRR